MTVEALKQSLRRWPWFVGLRRWLGRYMSKPHHKRLRDLDLRRDRSTPLSRRALLSYLVHPFSISPGAPDFLTHINIWHAQEIVRVLNRIGYSVDVIDYRDAGFVPQGSYDLFIGHGGINFESIVQQLSQATTVIYFATGSYWKFHNEQELARLAGLRERRGVELPPDRLIEDSEEGALRAAHAVVGIGNEFTRATYTSAGFSPVAMMNGTSLVCDHREHQDKDFESGRDHFLYFAGYGPVHKGLDLLLDVFAGIEQHLWICTKMDRSFEEAYSTELHSCRNIHLIGWIQPRSSRFFQLVDACNYVILPSCSEGQAQSVVECMNHGLIPVVSRQCGLDVNDYGVLVDPCTSEELASTVRTLSSTSASLCQRMSMKARQAATAAFSQEAFTANMRTAIEQMVALRESRKEAAVAGLAPLYVDESGNARGGRDAETELQSTRDGR